MVKWKPYNEILIIPNICEYSRDEHISMWHTRRSFYDMVNKNLEQVYKDQQLQKSYLVNFGKNWNIYYKGDNNNKMTIYKNPEYYRWKYMDKLGFPVVEYCYSQKIIKKPKKTSDLNNLSIWFNNIINVINNI